MAKKAARKKANTKVKLASAAILTVNDAPAMTPRGRKDTAAWLRRMADFLEQYGPSLSRNFRARYLYHESRRPRRR